MASKTHSVLSCPLAFGPIVRKRRTLSPKASDSQSDGDGLFEGVSFRDSNKAELNFFESIPSFLFIRKS